MSETLYRTQTLTTMTCCVCGVLYAMPETLRRDRKEDGGFWCCPNGHRSCYRESDLRKAERELARERASHDQTKAHCHTLRDARMRAERSLTRTKKRIGQGVCPCCNRYFANLGRHMSQKHPEYGASDDE